MSATCDHIAGSRLWLWSYLWSSVIQMALENSCAHTKHCVMYHITHICKIISVEFTIYTYACWMIASQPLAALLEWWVSCSSMDLVGLLEQIPTLLSSHVCWWSDYQSEDTAAGGQEVFKDCTKGSEGIHLDADWELKRHKRQRGPAVEKHTAAGSKRVPGPIKYVPT